MNADQINRVRRLHAKARTYTESDPEVALILSRKTAETLCKVIFAEHIRGDSDTLMLDRLIERLTSTKSVPKRVITHLRTRQVHGNFGAHDRADEELIDVAYIQPCIQSLDYVCQWFSDNLPPILCVGRVDVKRLAAELGLKPYAVIAELMNFNCFCNINRRVPSDLAHKIAEAHGRTITFERD